LRFLYEFLNIFFIIFHTSLIIFNLFGWIWRRTRRINLLTLLLTAFSWLVPGIWLGIGYCVFTDWHWRVRMAMGIRDMPNSYIKFLLNLLFGIDIDPGVVDILTAVCFTLAFLFSIIVNIRDYRQKAKHSF
jgi:hypothetical protein